jgi:hypothetical protein
MARSRKEPQATEETGARSAFNLTDAKEVGFLGVEKDATPDSEYASPGAGEGPNAVKLRKPPTGRGAKAAAGEADAPSADESEEDS